MDSRNGLRPGHTLLERIRHTQFKIIRKAPLFVFCGGEPSRRFQYAFNMLLHFHFKILGWQHCQAATTSQDLYCPENSCAQRLQRKLRPRNLKGWNKKISRAQENSAKTVTSKAEVLCKCLTQSQI